MSAAMYVVADFFCLRNSFKTLRTVFRYAQKACGEIYQGERVFFVENRKFSIKNTRSP
jgi:hypothetical protein